MKRGIIFCVLAVAFVLGCVSATPAKRAYQALDSIETGVHEAMNVLGDCYRKGIISEATWDEKIAPAYDKYRKASITAAQALVIYAQTKDPATFNTSSVGALAADILLLVAEFKAKPSPTPTQTPTPAPTSRPVYTYGPPLLIGG
jgi:hypothetical protein